MSIETVVLEINKEITRLRSAVAILSGGTSGKIGVRRRRPMSAAARAKIAAAQRARWAKRKRQSKKAR